MDELELLNEVNHKMDIALDRLLEIHPVLSDILARLAHLETEQPTKLQ
jgi:hypothetical protein